MRQVFFFLTLCIFMSIDELSPNSVAVRPNEAHCWLNQLSPQSVLLRRAISPWRPPMLHITVEFISHHIAASLCCQVQWNLL